MALWALGKCVWAKAVITASGRKIHFGCRDADESGVVYVMAVDV